MNKKNRHLSGLIILSAGLAVTGCSGKTEDVRIKTCKQLATTLLDVSDDVAWDKHREDIHEPEYAAIQVRASDGKVNAVCLYEYDAAEETYETHTDPLSAYSTVPYEVTLNGRTVPVPELYQAMNTLRLEAGKRLLDKAKGWAETARAKAEQVMD